MAEQIFPKSPESLGSTGVTRLPSLDPLDPSNISSRVSELTQKNVLDKILAAGVKPANLEPIATISSMFPDMNMQGIFASAPTIGSQLPIINPSASGIMNQIFDLARMNPSRPLALSTGVHPSVVSALQNILSEQGLKNPLVQTGASSSELHPLVFQSEIFKQPGFSAISQPFPTPTPVQSPILESFRPAGTPPVPELSKSGIVSKVLGLNSTTPAQTSALERASGTLEKALGPSFSRLSLTNFPKFVKQFVAGKEALKTRGESFPSSLRLVGLAQESAESEIDRRKQRGKA